MDWANFQEGKNSAQPIPLTYAAVASRGYHVGCATVARLDGSIRLVTDATDLQLWRDLSTGAGKEVTAIPD